jgi:hypothetical protein
MPISTPLATNSRKQCDHMRSCSAEIRKVLAATTPNRAACRHDKLRNLARISVSPISLSASGRAQFRGERTYYRGDGLIFGVGLILAQRPKIELGFILLVGLIIGETR